MAENMNTESPQKLDYLEVVLYYTIGCASWRRRRIEQVHILAPSTGRSWKIQNPRWISLIDLCSDTSFYPFEQVNGDFHCSISDLARLVGAGGTLYQGALVEYIYETLHFKSTCLGSKTTNEGCFWMSYFTRSCHPFNASHSQHPWLKGTWNTWHSTF